MTSVPGYPGHYHSISWKVVFPACCRVWIEPVFVCPFDILNISISNSLLETCFFALSFISGRKNIFYFMKRTYFFICVPCGHSFWNQSLLADSQDLQLRMALDLRGVFPGVDLKDAFWPIPRAIWRFWRTKENPQYISIYQYINIHLDTFGIYRLDITFCMIKVYCYICFVIFEVFQVHLQFYIVAYLGWRPWDSRKATRGRDLLASLNK